MTVYNCVIDKWSKITSLQRTYNNQSINFIEHNISLTRHLFNYKKLQAD